jgi:hypothetical protein
MVEALFSPKNKPKTTEILKSGKPFKDSQFPAKDSSLFAKKTKLKPDEVKEWKGI